MYVLITVQIYNLDKSEADIDKKFKTLKKIYNNGCVFGFEYVGNDIFKRCYDKHFDFCIDSFINLLRIQKDVLIGYTLIIQK